ncbi:MAG: hypothetical protein R6V58_06435 [Planctomycetota bacterium]
MPDRLDIAANWTEQRWRHMQSALGTIRLDTEHAAASLAVVFLPARVQYDRSHFDWLRSLGYRLPDSMLREPSRFQVKLGRWCGDHDAAFLDLTPAFRQADDPARLGQGRTGRLSAAGHALLADELAARLPRETARSRRTTVTPFQNIPKPAFSGHLRCFGAHDIQPLGCQAHKASEALERAKRCRVFATWRRPLKLT